MNKTTKKNKNWKKIISWSKVSIPEHSLFLLPSRSRQPSLFYRVAGGRASARVGLSLVSRVKSRGNCRLEGTLKAPQSSTASTKKSEAKPFSSPTSHLSNSFFFKFLIINIFFIFVRKYTQHFRGHPVDLFSKKLRKKLKLSLSKKRTFYAKKLKFC